MGRDEKALPDGRSHGKKGISAQSAAFVCTDLLWEGKGYCASGGLSGAQQCGDNTQIYHGQQHEGLPAAAGAGNAGGGISSGQENPAEEGGRIYPWRGGKGWGEIKNNYDIMDIMS